MNAYAYAGGNPIGNKDAQGRMFEISAGGTFFGLSGSTGFRFSINGINYFAAGGAGAGAGGYPISVSYTPGDIPHKTEVTTTAGGNAAYFAGLGASVSGQYVPQTGTLKDSSKQLSFVAGMGVDAYARKEMSIPILGGEPPEGLVLGPDSPFSTPNYRAAPTQNKTAYISSASYTPPSYISSGPSYTMKLYSVPNGNTVDWYGNVISTPSSQTKK